MTTTAPQSSALKLTWSLYREGTYRRSDDNMSIIFIHLTAGWRWCIYDRRIHNYRGASDGYLSPWEAMDIADALPPSKHGVR